MGKVKHVGIDLAWADFVTNIGLLDLGNWVLDFLADKKVWEGKRKIGYWVNHGLGLLNLGKRVFWFGWDIDSIWKLKWHIALG